MVMKHLRPAGLAAVLLILFFVPSSSAQTPTSIEGEWVGNSEPPGRSEFVRLSLTEDAGELRFPLGRATLKLSLVRREGSQVRFELSSLKLVMTGTITGDEIDGEAEVPGTKAPLRGSKQIYYNVNPRLAKPRPGLSSDRCSAAR